MSGRQWRWNLSVKASEPAGRGGVVSQEGAAHFGSMLLAALLPAVNTLCPCPGHISGASFLFLTPPVNVHVCSRVPLPGAPRVLLFAAECLVIAGLAAPTDKQLISRDALDRLGQ